MQLVTVKYSGQQGKEPISGTNKKPSIFIVEGFLFYDSCSMSINQNLTIINTFSAIKINQRSTARLF